MIAAAPPTTTKAPSEVSARSYPMNRGVIRLSMTFDCWKKSCHARDCGADDRDHEQEPPWS